MRRRRFNVPLIVLANKILTENLGLDPSQLNKIETAQKIDSFMVKIVDKKGKYKDPKMIDLNYHSQYEPTLGFRTTVEAIHNIDGSDGKFYAVLASVCPQASYYVENRQLSKGLRDGFTFTVPDL